jgi:ABC-type oligopeptide transport system ATPase subunit
MSERALLEVENLHLSLPDLTAKPLFRPAPRIEILRGLAFEIRRGSVLGIVGGSGSGKSTLGRTLIRLLEPTDGRIVFDGRDITHLDEEALRPLRRRFQMIFQDPLSSLNPRRRVSGIIAAPLRLHGLDEIERRVDEALDHVGLPRSFRNRYPHELSGGQRQRIGIARAIALRPEFILADEISPDNCRLWDAKTNEKMDKDRFRRDLGKVEEAYQEVARRLGIMPEAGSRDLKGPETMQ